MRRSFLSAILTITAVAFCAAALSPAEARKRSKGKNYSASKSRVLTIRKRSFLHSGYHPLPGSENRYVNMYTQHGTLPTRHQSDFYGGNVLPGPLGVFGPRY